MLIRMLQAHHPYGRTNVCWMPGDVVSVPRDLGNMLVNHWHAEPVPGEDKQDDWEYLRNYVGERPGDPGAFIPARNYLPFARAGNKILLIRKVGGLGDVLHVSLMLTEIKRQFPDCPLTFATARQYFRLFEGSGIDLLDQDEVFRGATVKGGIITSPVMDRFDIIEDVSTPCFLYESTQTYFGRDRLKWRPRLAIWSEWIGLKMNYDYLESPVKVTAPELTAARARYWPQPPYRQHPQTAVALCPISSNHARSLSAERWKPLKAALEAEGMQVAVFGVPYGDGGSHECGDSRDFVAAILAADVTVTVDSAASNICGIWKKPAVALYGITDGATYTGYYPTVAPLQLCDTPCCNEKVGGCGKRNPCCYHKFGISETVQAVKDQLEKANETELRMRGQDAKRVPERGRKAPARKRAPVPAR